MRVTIERLRTGIIVVAVVLVAAISIFLGVARYERKRLIRDLPSRLGIQIQSSADSFTFSKSDKGRTIFTIHASKAIQYKGGGHATLHDVSITLNGPNGDRADHIYGADFDYDPKSGIATATGEVDLDLQAPPAAHSDASQSGLQADPAKATIHVKTSGLVFDRNTGVATTHNFTEFRMPQGAGHATGASFDSQAGVLVLDSGVEIDSSSNGKTVSIQAAHAQILRDSRQAFLLNAAANYEDERAACDEAIVYFRPDGSAEHVDAKGHVHITGDSGQELKSQTAKVLFDEHSQPQHADFGGGFSFVSTDHQHHMHGAAVEAKVQFGAGAGLQHVQLLNAVSFVDQQLTLPDDLNASTTREVRAGQIDVDFAPETAPQAKAQHAAARQVLASGGAALVVHTISTKHPQQNTTISADQLLASIASGNAITSLTGTGHTRVVDVAADGAAQISTGDNLSVGFLPATGKKVGSRKDESMLAATQIQSGVQQGNVEITQTGPVGPQAHASTMHITAQRAEYLAGDQALHLDGNPRFNDGSLDLSSSTMDYERPSGIATANGNVKATYLQQAGASGATASAAGHGSLVLGGQGPAHIIADKATLNPATGNAAGNPPAGAASHARGTANGDAIFRGHARLWQGTNSISAPVIELSRSGQSLKAHADTPGSTSESRPGSADRVNTTLAGAATPQHAASLERIQSSELTYTAGDRQATFSGAVVAQDPSGTIHSDEAVVFLRPAASPLAESSVGSPASKSAEPQRLESDAVKGSQSQIDHLVATGHIVLNQPGRKATGDKLIYTASDGNFTLTGSASAPPRLIDQVHGEVTGASLIFNARDDSVTVDGGQSRASIDTRVRK